MREDYKQIIEETEYDISDRFGAGGAIKEYSLTVDREMKMSELVNKLFVIKKVNSSVDEFFVDKIHVTSELENDNVWATAFTVTKTLADNPPFDILFADRRLLNRDFKPKYDESQTIESYLINGDDRF